jgi:hypothetical protein
MDVLTVRTLPSNKDTRQAPGSIAWRFRTLQLATVGIDWGGAAGGLKLAKPVV